MGVRIPHRAFHIEEGGVRKPKQAVAAAMAANDPARAAKALKRHRKKLAPKKVANPLGKFGAVRDDDGVYRFTTAR